jgi:hypothetical protein
VERGAMERATRGTWFYGACSTWNVVVWSVQPVERGSVERAARGTWFCGACSTWNVVTGERAAGGTWFYGSGEHVERGFRERAA